MRGRPKLENSRTHQYRVRLNDEENEQLDYASRKTGRPKSDILRVALIDFCNTLRMHEVNSEEPYEDDYWDVDGISLKRVVTCPNCEASVRVDLEDECEVTSSERPMGADTLYEFDYETICPKCSRPFRVVGAISEYPYGALEYEDISTKTM